MNKTKPESDLSLAFNAILFILILAAVVIVVPLLFAQEADARSDKTPVELCHKPGTPAEHTITVDDNAVPAHLAHGDYLGPCKADPSPTSSIGDSATTTPGVTDPPAVWSDLTPPPTSTATMPADAPSSAGWLSVLVLVLSGAVGLLATLRRVR